MGTLNESKTVKTLTVIVPAYNSGKTLEKCLDSFYDESILCEVEIIIINDGSTDDTEIVANKFTDMHPSYRLINKANGGHGSGINVASGYATGKYIKVVDSDDWVVNFSDYVKALRDINADVVLTSFFTVDPDGKHIREYKMDNIEYGREYNFKDFWKHRKKVQNVCNFHGITYNTKFYTSLNIQLSEKISYEDQEYATLPFAQVKTICPLNLTLYKYRIGDTTQSTSDANMVKQLGQLEYVFWNVHSYAPKSMSKASKNYFLFKERNMLLSCYMTAMLKSQDKKNGRVWAKELRKKVKQRDLPLYRSSSFNYYTCLFLSHMHFDRGWLYKLQRNRMYGMLAKLMH